MYAGLQAVAWALFLWWFSTGAIIWLDGLPRWTFRYSLAGATVILVLALLGIRATAPLEGPGAAYQAFSCALLAWAWHEITFYMGWLTGPRKVRCSAGCSGWPHFLHALEASLWHELALLASGALIAWLVHGQSNPVALWTFLVLWMMHQSARLNVLLGVRNLNAHFLPEHLDYLRGFLRRRPMNLLFPVSVSLATAAFAWFARDVAALPAGSLARTGGVLVLSVLALGILEHWFLVLPLPFAALWDWGLHTPGPAGPERRRRLPPRGGGSLQSWSATLSGVCDPARLRTLLEALAGGQYGQLERVQGLVRAESGWLVFDLAGGRPAIAAHAAHAGEQPRVTAIGRGMDGPGLLQAFVDCTLPGALQTGALQNG